MTTLYIYVYIIWTGEYGPPEYDFFVILSKKMYTNNIYRKFFRVI